MPDGGAPADGGTTSAACLRALAERGVTFAPAPREPERPAGRPDLLCVVDDPVLLEPVIRGIAFRLRELEAAPTPLFSSCALALAIDRMAEVMVQRQVTEVIHLGIYGCRVIAGTDVLSEHALARALDVAAVRLAGGAVYSVAVHWEKDQPAPATPAGMFLRGLVTQLFDSGVFNIILTPDFNEEHRDHFHLDLTPDARLLR
jgi:hypothetical protein